MTVLLRSIRGAKDSVDLALGPADKASYLLGKTVSISGYADFWEGTPPGASLSLIIYGPQPTTLPLSIAPGIHLYPEINLEVSVSSLSSTLPSTLPLIWDSRIEYRIRWIPSIFLDPAPSYTLIPETTQAFSLPMYTPPSTSR
jgi:hypothetical protein